ncbi:MAG: MgtC/SapB transporter [Chitinophagaceae bacterium]|jgi:putative Mg2+ transporter-C (MgtC) family protein|nr:MgtC/SapB transporter [Chitinophagaceae bacterium]
MEFTDDMFKVLAALVAGAMLGFEREFHDKPAGLRTLTLICIGSTIFTIISQEYFNQDRVASNIVTGIGFLGAGVMMREGLTVRGITTASTIWVTAAIGMTIGVGAYLLAAVELVLVLATLVIMNRFERVMQNIIQKRIYEITFRPGEGSWEEVERQFKSLDITYSLSQLKKNMDKVVVVYRVTAGRKTHAQLSRLLATNAAIEGFEA